MKPEEIVYRQATEEDAPLIFSSWLKSMRNRFPFKEVSSPIYFSNHHKVIENLLKKGNTLLACSSHDPSQIMSYIVFEEIDGIFVMHFIYTKRLFRGLGIARALLHQVRGPTTKAAIHTAINHVNLALQFNSVFNPYLAYDGFDASK